MFLGEDTVTFADLGSDSENKKNIDTQLSRRGNKDFILNLQIKKKFNLRRVKPLY
tara:strand:+ start:1337 stop:1501 length:165 start_codon:yes stop_codon:yes gene_type:complete